MAREAPDSGAIETVHVDELEVLVLHHGDVLVAGDGRGGAYHGLVALQYHTATIAAYPNVMMSPYPHISRSPYHQTMLIEWYATKTNKHTLTLFDLVELACNDTIVPRL